MLCPIKLFKMYTELGQGCWADGTLAEKCTLIIMTLSSTCARCMAKSCLATALLKMLAAYLALLQMPHLAMLLPSVQHQAVPS